MRIINNLEKIGDHAEDMSRLAQRKYDQQLPFSAIAMKQLEDISRVGSEFLDLVTSAIRDNNPDIEKETSRLESELDRMEEAMRDFMLRTSASRLSESCLFCS